MNLSPINPSDEFLRHAADCQQMAKFTRDPASKATWRRMAASSTRPRASPAPRSV